MNRLFVPTFGPSDWRRLLGNPGRQWRTRKSAWECAVAWESVRDTERGLSKDVAELFDTSEAFRNAKLLLAIPEHQVALVGGGHPSQTDLWALIAAPVGVVSVAVEAKAGESFDKRVSEWLEDAGKSSGKPARLQQLCGILEVNEREVQDCRYQLLHRPVAALLEADRFRLGAALFLVHAFGENSDSLADFVQWATLLGAKAAPNTLCHVGARLGVELWIGWLQGRLSTPDVAIQAI